MSTSATDIYGRTPVQVGGVFLSDMAIMTLSTSAGTGTSSQASSSGGTPASLGVGALVQNVECTYAQQANAIYELGSSKMYVLAGRPLGQISVGKIVSTKEFDTNLFNACLGGATISFSGTNGGCDGITANFARTLTGVFITSYGFTMNTQELMIRESLQGLFASMSAANS